MRIISTRNGSVGFQVAFSVPEKNSVKTRSMISIKNSIQRSNAGRRIKNLNKLTTLSLCKNCTRQHNWGQHRTTKHYALSFTLCFLRLWCLLYGPKLFYFVSVARRFVSVYLVNEHLLKRELYLTFECSILSLSAFLQGFGPSGL